MVERQIAARGAFHPRTLDAMRQVPREAFVPEHLVAHAYRDAPLPIGEGQTISQPLIVATMADALELTPTDRVLEVGAGSGYAAAVLSRLAGQVFAVERFESLAHAARLRLGRLGYGNVSIRCGDGTLGWREHAPFDAILVSAGGPDVPPSLLDQLSPGGRLVMPVGRDPRAQELLRIRRAADGRYDEESLGPVHFVPLVGSEGWSTG